MSTLDWILVIGLNGSIIVHALLRAPKIASTGDWFLASRNLPWWIVGLSAYATAIDSSDMVADSGGVYKLGLSYFVTNWVGTVVGWIVLAHFVIRPMYRLGMYTNAEYLEARFGVAARAISVLVQLQYRMVVMGIMAATVYLTLAIVGGLGSGAWWAVGGFVLLATAYTIRGGSGSIAWTDAAQSFVMMSASFLFFIIVWNQVGGWSGIQGRLAAHDAALPAQLLHAGHDRIDSVDVAGKSSEEVARHLLLGGQYDERQGAILRRTPAWLMCVEFLLVGIAYAIVNHEQAMRMFGSRSLWDLKMAAAMAGLLLIVATALNLGMGIMGRALFPDVTQMPIDKDITETKSDAVYPLLLRDFTGNGFRGIIVAGLLAAALSTYTGTGAALASLITRDVYGRLVAVDRDDRHYLRVGRWLTLAVIACSFAYVPFVMAKGMLFFYLDMVGAFVIPLLTIYLMGALTRVHRSSGTIGLIVGVTYGVVRLVAEPIAVRWGVTVLPSVAADVHAGYPIGMALTAGTMLCVSLVRGWEPPGELLHEETTGWLRASQLQVRRMDAERAASEIKRPDWIPIAFGLAVIGVGTVLSFVVFW